MVIQVPPKAAADVIYPETDGQPMASNTTQFRWIVLVKENLEILFAEDPNVLIAGDLFWYPVEGSNAIVAAPDAMVVLGRPKGDRPSYLQWREDNVAPQVVFEILSPSNTPTEMESKLLFYDRYGVEEYYIYDPFTNDLSGFWRRDGALAAIATLADWVSPRLGIRFDLSGAELQLFHPNGDRFLTSTELSAVATQAQQQLEQKEQQLAAEQQRSQALAERLRSLGIDPD